jgi:hypothetical protein
MTSEKTKRNAYAAEAATGVGAAALVGSNRVPEIVNSLVIRRRKSEAQAKEKKYGKAGNVVEGRQTYRPGSHGLTAEGQKVRLKSLPQNAPGGELVPAMDSEGKQRINPKGEPVFNKTKPSFPRAEAVRRAVEQKSAPARANAGNKANLPFPTSNWEYEPAGTPKPPKYKMGRHSKGGETMGRHAGAAIEPPGRLQRLALKAKNFVADSDPELSDSGKMQRARWTYNEKGVRVRTPAHLGQMRRKAVMMVGLPVAAGMAWHGTHGAIKEQRKINKKLEPNDATAGLTGGAAGLAAYQAPSYMEYQSRGKADKKANQKPKAQAALDKWKAKYKIEAGTPRGVPKWDEAYRHYPKQMPDWKARRLMAYTHTGATGRAAFAGATATGVAAGVGARHLALRAKENHGKR